MKSQARYCIIGAGYCGLGVAKAFVDAGLDFDCFDVNDDIGGNWLNGVYDSTHIISSRDSTQYGDYPMPREYPDFPSRGQVLDYLQSYANVFRLRERIQFKTEVLEVKPLSGDGMKGWEVKLSNGETRQYAGVVVANGHHWSKRIPNYPGKFSGKTLHSKDYKNVADFEGKRVLVVGAGNSGCDIAVEAASEGKESFISMRRGYYFIPKTIFGVPSAELDHPWVPVFAQKAFMKMVIRITQGSNEKYGLQKPDHDLFDFHPIVNSQLLYSIRHGKVQPKPDIQKFDGNTVHFVDGTSLDVDTIVYATGFNVAFPFLDHSLFEWKNGIPKRVAMLFRPKTAGLYVFGLSQPRGGAGPLVTEASKFLTELVQAQKKLNYPIANDFEALAPADAKMLVGVSEAMREIQLGRIALRFFVKRAEFFKRVQDFDAPSPPEGPQTMPIPRNLKFPFNSEIPKHWFGNAALGTHMMNGMSLIFPSGERQFVMSVRAFADRIQDAELKERVNAFIAQEVQHGREHESHFNILREQGFEFEEFLKQYEDIAFNKIASLFSKEMRLSTTAALEHVTAVFGEHGLKHPVLTEQSHPVMRDLFLWHACEEIEHKSVAFDVLQAVAPGYPLRLAGFFFAMTTFPAAWAIGTATLLRQDPDADARRLIQELKQGLEEKIYVRPGLLRDLFNYIKPGFHPDQVKNEPPAREALKQMGNKYSKEQRLKSLRTAETQDTSREPQANGSGIA